jgi:hypothetical protein
VAKQPVAEHEEGEDDYTVEQQQVLQLFPFPPSSSSSSSSSSTILWEGRQSCKLLCQMRRKMMILRWR